MPAQKAQADRRAHLSAGLAQTCHKEIVAEVVSLFVHPFMHRRECMSIFHHTYAYIESLRDSCSKKLPQYVQDELITAALLLPVAASNVRLPVSVRISATDASLGGGR